VDVEQELVDCIARGSRPFHDAVDAFVGQLLSEVGYSHRPTDGVLFEWKSIEHGRAAGTGIIVMIDHQQVQPLRVEFVLDATSGGLASGFVHFGSTDVPDAPYGSHAHRELVKQMLADPTVEFPWIERFYRDSDGWHREPPNPSLQPTAFGRG
jgi:hypothetical protein